MHSHQENRIRWHTAVRGGIVGPARSKVRTMGFTTHTLSIPAHAAGTPRHSERRHVGIPPEEAESSARAKQGSIDVPHHPYPADSGPRGRDSNSTSFRTSSCWRTAGRGGIVGPARSKAQSTCFTTHPLSIPAHAAGTPRHSERRHVGVPPEEAESSARHEARYKRRASPPIPRRFRPSRLGLIAPGAARA
jgi:hypothetical protein